MKELRWIDACEERHFRDMSLLHALGWRAAYRDSIPADYMAREITDSPLQLGNIAVIYYCKRFLL